jgi:hypothetical protein
LSGDISAYAVVILIALVVAALLVRYRIRWWTVLALVIGAILIFSFFYEGNAPDVDDSTPQTR